MPITSVQVSCASLKLEATFPVYPPALEIASLKKDLAQMVKPPPRLGLVHNLFFHGVKHLDRKYHDDRNDVFLCANVWM